MVAALVLPLVVAAILVPFRSSFANTASALVLVAVIVAVAAIGSRAAGFLAAGVHRVGLPGPELVLLAQNRGQTLGRFVFTPTPGFPVSLQRRIVAVALADQVGGALRPQVRSA